MAFLAFAAWALWRERRVIGSRTAASFWLLRSVALATVIWMLLAPANVRIETSTTRKAIAVAVDVSGSMQTVDPAGTAEEWRWAISSDNDGAAGATQAADRAVAAIGVAQRRMHEARQSLKQHLPESAVHEALSSAQRALGRAKSHLDVVKSAASASSEVRALADRTAKLLAGPEFESFEQLAIAIEKGRTPSQTGWRESLPDLEHRLTSLHRALSELAHRAAEAEASQVALSNPDRLARTLKAPRLERTAAFLEQLQSSTLASLGGKADVYWTSFDASAAAWGGTSPLLSNLAPHVQPNEPAGSAGSTDISAVLEQVNRQRQDQPLAAVLLFSDMAHNQPAARNPRDAAAALAGAPVHVVPIGNTQRVRDVLIQSVSAPPVVMRNDDIVIEVSVRAYKCGGETCVVQLLQEGEVVDFRELRLDSDFASRTVRFDRRLPAVGVERFQVAVTPLGDELTDENNYSEFEVNVTRNEIKVLLADELPRWEYRYLAQLFRRDPKIACDELLFHPRLIATGRREASQAAPMTVDDWDQYDVAVLGDLAPEHLPAAAQESAVRYVQERGGALIFIAGNEAMPQAYANHPLSQILPVMPVADAPSAQSGYAFHVTEEGAQHDALMIGETAEATQSAWDFVNRFSPLYELSLWRRPRPSAHTLIAAVPRDATDNAHPTNAFLCWQPVGRGRVVYLAGPETYRLRFLRGDRLHYRFWGQLLRWSIASDLAAGTNLVRIRTNQSRYHTGETVEARVVLRDVDGQPIAADDLHVRLTSGDDVRTAPLSPTNTPGEYRAEVDALPPGVYRIEPLGPLVEQLQSKNEQAPAAASFTVRAKSSQELIDTRADRALAQQIADITGGQVAPPTAVAEILELTNFEPIVSERVERRPLWVRWKYLWIVFGCLQIEWCIRKWKGWS
jgi:hypothetical protein